MYLTTHSCCTDTRRTWPDEPLQDDAVVKKLRDAGYVIENRTKHSGQQVHGEFRLVSCPGDADVRMISAAFSAETSDL